MREDQYEKLQALSEKLLDVFIAEADPAQWPGKGLSLGQMDAQTRGDLYWVRKTAASVLVLEAKISTRIAAVQLAGNVTAPAAGADPETEAESQVDAEMARYEKDALKVIAQIQGTGKVKQAFDRKVHGRP